MIKQKEFLHFVDFKTLSFWDVKRLSFSSSIFSKYPLEKLEGIFIPRKEKIKKDDYKNDIEIVAKIKFNNGKIYLRDEKKTGMDLYKLYRDDLLVSNINFHQGAVAINSIEDTLVCSTHYQPYIINDLIDKDYLIMILRNSSFLNYVVNSKVNGIKTESRYKFIKDLQIPLPKLEIQKKIVKQHKDKIKKAKEYKNKANELEKSIDKYLIKKLGIEYSKKEKKSDKFLDFASFKNIQKWGINSILNNQNVSIILLSKKYSMCYLDLPKFQINPRISLKNKDQNLEISFIPMKNVSDVYGEIKEQNKGFIKQAKNYTKFQENDLLWAKITPCMQNGKSAIATNLKNKLGYGSTEFHVIRSLSDGVNIEYVHCLLRMEKVLKNAMLHFTGSSGQQRVSIKYLKNLQIPIPPLNIQNKIVKHINKIKQQIKSSREQSQALTNQAKEEFNKEIFN